MSAISIKAHRKIFFLKYLKDYHRLNDQNQALETSGSHCYGDIHI